MRFLKIFALSLFLSVPAFAESQFALEGGFRQQNGETPSGITAKPVTGYQFGGLGYFPIVNDFYFRTGLFYTQRTLRGDRVDSTVDYEYKMNYVDVPLTAFYKFSDFGGVFAGVVLANNFEKSWSVSGRSVDDVDVRSTLIPAVLGASFKFLPQVGMSVFYELIGGEVARDLKNYKAVGVNLAVYFE
jgi:hypothetical protein